MACLIRIHDLPHIVDIERFRRQSASADVAAIRVALTTSESQVVLLFVGKLAPHKRPLDLVDAVAQLAEEERRRFVLWYVGSGVLQTEIEQRAEAADVNCRMLGFRNQSELPEIYAAADCLVLTSHETWGLVVNEAFACGTPALVSSSVGCSSDLIENGVTGWCIESGVPGLLAKKIRQFSRTLLSSLSEAVVERAEKYTLAEGSRIFVKELTDISRDVV